jgi:hypothetical protein
MTARALQTILKKSGEFAEQTQPTEIGAIDFSRPFIPEDRTQLYYSPLYHRLSDRHRLRYNQLFAIRVNEYIMTLESDIVDHFLRPLCRNGHVRRQTDLRRCLETMIAEEKRHYAIFLDLNRRCLPDAFTADQERYFTRQPAAMQMAMRALRLAARTLPFPIWFVMAMEEEAMDLARAMVKQPVTETLGELEPQFVAVHREHLKDEARHIIIDQHLVEKCLTRNNVVIRRVNARLFKAFMGLSTRVGPNGPGARVIRHLVSEHPELEPLQSEMINEILSLSDSHTYQSSLFNRKGAPLSFGIFDSMPEFEDLGRYLIGYDRH